MSIASSIRPAGDEYNPYYAPYVARVPEGDVVRALGTQGEEIISLLKGLTEAQAESAYAEGKWSIKDVLQHIIDTERVFTYRLMRIARGDQTPLASFDQDAYVPMAEANARALDTLLGEFAAVRGATLALLRWLPEAAWTRRGVAGGKDVTARALAWMACGHAMHHEAVLRTEYYGILQSTTENDGGIQASAPL